MMIGTILSRLLGLVRESVMAYLFGATPIYDAFLIAFLVPNLLRQLLAEGALSSSFIPVFNERLVKEGKDSAWRLFNLLLSTLLILFLALLLIGYLILPYLVKGLAPGFSLHTYRLCLSLSKITLPFIAFISFAALSMGVLNSFGNFFIPGVAPAFFNISIIVLSLFFYKSLGIYSVALGATIGGALQWVFQMVWLRKLGWQFRLIIDFKDEGLRKIGSMMLPLTLGLAINQIQNLADRIIASLISPGGISVLNYAFRLYQLPMGIFAVSFSTVALPLLSRDALAESLEEFEGTLSSALRLALFVMVPASIFLFLFSDDLIKFLFYRGSFTHWAFKNTSMTLRFYSLGLAFAGLTHILLRGFYALKNTKTPVFIGIWVVSLNVILNFLFGKIFGPPGLALATSVAFAVNFSLLRWKLLSYYKVNFRLVRFLGTLLFPSVIFGIALFFINRLCGGIIGILLSFPVALAYIWVCEKMKIEEAQVFINRLRSLFESR